MTPLPRSAAAEKTSSALHGMQAEAASVCEPEVIIHRYLAAYLMGLANRLSSGASAHYRKHWNIGMSEWRAMMAIGASSHRIAREVAKMADLDNAAVSKSLKALQERGFVELELTGRRGRAALVKLTPKGLAVYEELRASAERRQERLIAAFTPEETDTLWALLRKLHPQVSVMNTDDPPPRRKAATSVKSTARALSGPPTKAVGKKTPVVR